MSLVELVEFWQKVVFNKEEATFEENKLETLGKFEEILEIEFYSNRF